MMLFGTISNRRAPGGWPTVTLTLALALAPASACTGIIGGAGEGPGQGGDTQLPAICADSDMAAAAPDAPSTRVRRLTTLQIQNSTGLLLDKDAQSALSNLESDSQLSGRFSNSAELSVSESFASSLNLSAETIGTQFKKTVTKAAYGAACFASDGAAEGCAKTFIQTFGKKAFRRNLTDTDTTGLLAVYKAGRDVGTDGDAGDRFATGLSWVVRAIVQSPNFIYLTELGDPAAENGKRTTLLPDEVANALSYAVVGMPPDDLLTAAAQQDQLGTADQRAMQVMRLIDAYPENWQQQMRQFVLQWLGINFSNPEWAKDTKVAPLFSAALKDALEAETNLFIDDWATSPDGPRLDTLLTTPSTFINSVNAPVYGTTATGTTFQKVSLDPTQRAGILTFSGFLGTTSHVAETSPVVRGKVILQKFLCQDVPPPPPVVPPLPPKEKSAPTTTRERFATHLTDATCQVCHNVFDPMGNAFEEYDILGSFRTEQNGHPIDSSGALVGATDGDKPVADAVALAKVLAESPDTFDCVARYAYRFTLGRAESTYDQCTLAVAKKTLAQSPFDVRGLMSSIVGSPSFVVRTVNQ